MSRVTVVLKTNEGGMWILPQVAELRRRRVDVTVILPPGPGRLRRALDDAGVGVVESPFDFSFRPRWALIRGLLALRRTIRATAPDVLFYHLYASALASRMASLGLRLRRVHMVAGPLYLESGLIRNGERLLCRIDHHLIAGSAHTAQKYKEVGLAVGRMSYVPYGVDVSWFQKGSDRRTELFGCRPDTFVVIMVAYVYAPKGLVHAGAGIKGHDVLLRAWSRFREHRPNSVLVLVGSGFGRDGEIHRRKLKAEHMGAGQSGLLWFDSAEDVRPFYSSADLSISPSLSENHGAALEASAMSLPCIVSDAGGLPETVTPQSGWTVRRGSDFDLELALFDAHRRFMRGDLAAMGRAARAHVESGFAAQRCVRLVADVLTASKG